MLKIIHVVGEMNRGGSETMLMDIIRKSNKEIKHFLIVNYKKKIGRRISDYDDELVSMGCEMYHIQTQWELYYYKYYRELKKVINSVNPDAIHLHLNAKSGFVAYCAKKAGIKNIIIHSHANLKYRGSLIKRTILNIELVVQKKLINQYGTHFWACSYEAANSIFSKKNLQKDRFQIINNAIDVDKFINSSNTLKTELISKFGIDEQTTIFGNIGRIVAHKNVRFLIDLLSEYSKIDNNFILIIAGRKEEPLYFNSIIKSALEKGIRNKIKYIGQYDDIPNLMKSFDIFLGPALQEGFGLVALEAQCAGVPCVLYKGFPKSVDIGLDMIDFMDSFDLQLWIAAINRKRDKAYDIKKIKELIINKGFDSASNTLEIIRLYNNNS